MLCKHIEVARKIAEYCVLVSDILTVLQSCALQRCRSQYTGRIAHNVLTLLYATRTLSHLSTLFLSDTDTGTSRTIPRG